jgi:hypothetical protein
VVVVVVVDKLRWDMNCQQRVSERTGCRLPNLMEENTLPGKFPSFSHGYHEIRIT